MQVRLRIYCTERTCSSSSLMEGISAREAPGETWKPPIRVDSMLGRNVKFTSEALPDLEGHETH